MRPGGEEDLEKFAHGVNFGHDPADYEQPGEDYLWNEKEFVNIGDPDNLQNDLNNPNANQSSEFENSDNQLMEILRNKKKPTPRITIDRVRGKKPDTHEDIEGLGAQISHKVKG